MYITLGRKSVIDPEDILAIILFDKTNTERESVCCVLLLGVCVCVYVCVRMCMCVF